MSIEHCVESGVDDIRDMGHLRAYENICAANSLMVER
jgi:hypothetical protein